MGVWYQKRFISLSCFIFPYAAYIIPVFFILRPIRPFCFLPHHPETFQPLPFLLFAVPSRILGDVIFPRDCCTMFWGKKSPDNEKNSAGNTGISKGKLQAESEKDQI